MPSGQEGCTEQRINTIKKKSSISFVILRSLVHTPDVDRALCRKKCLPPALRDKPPLIRFFFPCASFIRVLQVTRIASQDPWIAADKAEHFLACSLGQAACAYWIGKGSLRAHRHWIALLITGALGYLKEVGDLLGWWPGTYSYRVRESHCVFFSCGSRQEIRSLLRRT